MDINRRDFLKLLSSTPFLAPLALEIVTTKESADVHFLKSTDYVIGVGDSTIPASRYDAALMGANQAFTPAKLVRQVGEPGNYSLNFEGEFGVQEANFAWHEIALYHSGNLIKRKSVNCGIKTPASVWAVEYKLSISYDLNLPLEEVMEIYGR